MRLQAIPARHRAYRVVDRAKAGGPCGKLSNAILSFLFSGAGSFLRRSGALGFGALPRGGASLPRKRLFRSGGPAFALERLRNCARPGPRWRFGLAFRPLLELALGFAARFLRSRAFLRRRQLYSSPASLRQTDHNCLFGRSRTVFSLADMFHFLAHKLTGLGRGRLAFALVLASTFNCFFFWHNRLFSLTGGEPAVWSFEMTNLNGLSWPLLVAG